MLKLGKKRDALIMNSLIISACLFAFYRIYFFNKLMDNVSEVLMICAAKQDENCFESKMLRVLPVSLLVCCQDALWKFLFEVCVCPPGRRLSHRGTSQQRV